MDMKAAMDLTYNKKAIYYYSMSGNTKALVTLADTHDYDIYNMATIHPDDLEFKDYDTLLIGTSTVGRGVPHRYFKDIYPQLNSLTGRKVGLFGSGNSIYDVYCGALDLLESVFQENNTIIFKFKFESYPTKKVIKEFNDLIGGV